MKECAGTERMESEGVQAARDKVSAERIASFQWGAWDDTLPFPTAQNMAERAEGAVFQTEPPQPPDPETVRRMTEIARSTPTPADLDQLGRALVPGVGRAQGDDEVVVLLREMLALLKGLVAGRVSGA